ncbi:aspartyl-phosphate phosphatase Spo0E family protein [Petroclostridium sp. X23]|jgi:hypothetical protein|uniref:aspartyl-phosphate phosphatase Spo0E family protein n=1 Tax=Petroclostridium sp. X23 TaxID=3045146 RepID=UPI0024AD1270|nr:aspartyl-phosphate phosphatase Spo0E family protein [Petroclostridium sp. X23]WHH58883.1 aspartyl-phosphate phosphatase Spo0E family protein [Petroclostridium sp. X23]
MLNDQIVALRNKLNNLLVRNADYDQIYAISIELDKLIVEYYNQSDSKKAQNINKAIQND